MSKKIRKGDVVLAKDLTEDYLGAKITTNQEPGLRASLLFIKHLDEYPFVSVYLFRDNGRIGFYTMLLDETEVTILSLPWRYPEEPKGLWSTVTWEDKEGREIAVLNAGDYWVMVSEGDENRSCRMVPVPWDSVLDAMEYDEAEPLTINDTADGSTKKEEA